MTRKNLSSGLSSLVILAACAVFPVCGQQEPATYGQGWIANKALVDQEVVRLGLPAFGDVAPRLMHQSGADAPEDYMLWDAERKVLGDLIPPRDQRDLGACVGFGTAHACEILICQAIAREGLIRGPPVFGAGVFREVSPEAIYAGSRVQIGGGRVRGDGSVGVWSARWVTEYGAIPRDRYSWCDLSSYDTRLARQLGNTGIPPEGQRLARQYPVKTAARVNSWAEVQAAIRNGYPVVVCSNVGFADRRDGRTPGTRDAQGFIAPNGRWDHCMVIDGIQGGARPGGHIRNSWGSKAHGGPVGKGNPSTAGFWADARVIDSMVRQGDSWALSQFDGYPARRGRYRF